MLKESRMLEENIKCSMKGSMKGQIFLIIAILFILFFVVLRNGMSLAEILENQKTLEENLDRLEFDNIRLEYINAISTGFNSTINITNNTVNFTRYVQLVEQSKGLDIKALSVQASFGNVSPSTDITLNITAFNLLGETISYLNLTFTNATPAAQKTFSSIPDNTTQETFFNFNTGSAVNYTLYISWNTSSRNSSETITIPVDIAQSKYAGFFDFELVGKRSNHRDKFTETVTISKP